MLLPIPKGLRTLQLAAGATQTRELKSGVWAVTVVPVGLFPATLLGNPLILLIDGSSFNSVNSSTPLYTPFIPVPFGLSSGNIVARNESALVVNLQFIPMIEHTDFLGGM